MNTEACCVESILRRLSQSDDSVCYHIENADVFTVSELLCQKLEATQKSATFVNCLTPRPRWYDRFFPESTVSWFARSAGCSRQDAVESIAQLPVPIHKYLTFNAGNPRCILAVAAFAQLKPDFLIYTTAGMDPQGIKILQKSIAKICEGVRTIHVCPLPVSDEGMGRCRTQLPMKCIYIPNENRV